MVLTRQVILDRLNHVTVAAVTTQVRDLPTEVELTVEHGMPRPCVVSLDNLHTIYRGFLTGRITTLDATTMSEVCQALRIAVDC